MLLSSKCTPLRQLAEYFSEGWHAFSQLIKIVFRNDEDVQSGTCPDSGIPGLLRKQGHLTKVVAAPQSCQEFLRTVFLPQNVAFAVFDNVHAVTHVALPEHDVAGLEMLVLDAMLGCDFGLRQVGGEQ